jgi:predicted RNase H-like nuclease (RuvC/YqgF family)
LSLMPDASIPVAEAARLLEIPEEEAEKLADAGGRVPLETVKGRVGVAAVALELARSREEVGRLSGRLEEIRASNARLQKELKESVEERRRLTQEVLELRAAAEERLMLMERIEHLARIEKELEESSSEVERLRSRRLLDRLRNR